MGVVDAGSERGASGDTVDDPGRGRRPLGLQLVGEAAKAGIGVGGLEGDQRHVDYAKSIANSDEMMPLREASVQAQLSVRRGQAAIAFYKAAFGAVEVFRFGGDAPDDEVVAQLAVGDSWFWVEDESPEHHNFSPESIGGSTERMLLVVDDPTMVFGQAVAAGATEVYPMEDAHGWLLGRVVDPFGHHWEIGKPLVAWPPSNVPEGDA